MYVPGQVCKTRTALKDRALESSNQGSILNVVLRGPSLANDVQAILRAENEYNADLFL